MTFGLGIRLREGLIAIADTRITSGTEVTQARKISIYEHNGRSFFLLTSGLRSLRDMALTYFEERLALQAAPYERLFQAVNAFAADLRRVSDEDKAALQESNLPFDLHCLVGGQLSGDSVPHLYLIYPEGNWVEIGVETPYQIIGVGGYGKPVLDRALTFDDSIRHALKVGLLAFDATQISASNVDLPIDVVVIRAEPYQVVSHRFEKADLAELSAWWQGRVRQGVEELPSAWQAPILDQLGY